MQYFFFVDVSYLYINMYAIFKVILLFANIKSVFFFFSVHVIPECKKEYAFCPRHVFCFGQWKILFFLLRDESG